MKSKQRAKALKATLNRLNKKQTKRREMTADVDGITFTVDETGSVATQGVVSRGMMVELPRDLTCVGNPHHVIECLHKADPWIKKVFDAADERRAESEAKWQQKSLERQLRLQKLREQKRKQLEAIDGLLGLKINVRKDGTVWSDGKVPDEQQIDSIRLAVDQLTEHNK